MASKSPIKPQDKKPAPNLAEEPARPSSSKWGVKDNSLARGGLDTGTLSPGKTGGANLA